MKPYHDTFSRFVDLIKNRRKDTTVMALIIDSPWLPGYTGVNTFDFYFDQGTWMDAHIRVLNDLPGVAFVPGSWIEFGMAAEPSGWGVPIRWSPSSPPSIKHVPGGLEALLEAELPDPEKDGLMPVILRQYKRYGPPLAERGIEPRMAAARGPLAVASHLLGVSELLMAMHTEPEDCLALLTSTTDLCIRWLNAQLNRMTEPVGILVLDDLVGMMGPADAEIFAFPFLKRIFKAFPGLIHIFHNDTPNEAVYGGLAGTGMDVFNFTHRTSVERARELVGPDIVLMGNVPPLDILVRETPETVRKETEILMHKAAACGPVLVSCGGGVSPGTPIENLQAMADVVHSHTAG